MARGGDPVEGLHALLRAAGIYLDEGADFEAIGRALDPPVSASRARQIAQRALRKLRAQDSIAVDLLLVAERIGKAVRTVADKKPGEKTE